MTSSGGANNLGGIFYPQSSSSVVEKIPIVVRKTPIPANTQFVFPLRLEDEVGNSLETVLHIVTAPLPPQFGEENFSWKIPEDTPVGTESVFLFHITSHTSRWITLKFTLKILMVCGVGGGGGGWGYWWSVPKRAKSAFFSNESSKR